MAVEFEATNNATGSPGGMRFDNEIGLNYSKQVLSNASSFIWSTFEQSEGDRKNVQLVSLFIETMDGVAHTIGNEIHVSAGYTAKYTGDVKTEIVGVLYHESTHVWQWDGNGTAPGGLIEGIADFVRLKAGYIPSHWVKPGQGDRWHKGYDVTARFLEYCNGLKSSFVAQLNAKIKTGCGVDFLVKLLGKRVARLRIVVAREFCRLGSGGVRPRRRDVAAVEWNLQPNQTSGRSDPRCGREAMHGSLPPRTVLSRP